MIPLNLSLSGIYSYREKQEIDFRTLTAAHLFGIFGVVGSGKSAILEAITFALYGETERLNLKEFRYNFMNLKSNEAFIRFDFIAPGESGIYRATSKGKRNSRNPEDVKWERSLYRMDGTDLIPIEKTGIVSILGLSYDNFRRTIIIPQGKFQEFLQLSATQRTDMVKELFNLQRFDLAAKTGILQKKNDLAISNCEGQLIQIGEVPEEEVRRKQDELVMLEKELGGIRLLLKQQELLESEMKRTGEWYASLVTNREILAGLETQKETVQTAQKRLDEFDECVSSFKSDLDLLDNQKRQHLSGQKELEIKQAELAIGEEKLILSENRFNVARKEFADRENLSKQASELELCAKINKLYKTVSEISSRIATGETLLNESVKEWENQKGLAKGFAELQGTLKMQLPDINVLQKAREWFSQDRLLKERLEVQRQKETSLAKEIREFSTAITGIAVQNELPSDLMPYDPRIRHLLEERKREADSALQQIQQQLLQLEIQDRLKVFASELEEGKPCPLCGSADHPHILQVEGVEKGLEVLISRKSVVELQLKRIDDSVTRTGMLLESIRRKQPDWEKAAEAVKEAETALKEHQEQFAWTGYTEEKLDVELNRYSLLLEKTEELNRQSKEAAEKAETESAKLSGFNKRLEDLRLERGKAQQNAETLISQISRIDFKAQMATTAEALREESENLQKKYIAIGDEYAKAEKLHNALASSVQNLGGTVGNMQQSSDVLALALKELQMQLEARVLVSRFNNEKEIREILASGIDRPKEQQLIRQFHERLATVSSALEQLEKQLEGKAYNAEDHEKLRRQVGGLKEQESGQNQLKIAADIELARMKKAFADSQVLKSELRNLEIRRDNLKTLADLFRAQGFVNFVSTIHLQNLVQGANERFYRLTRQQLKLELDEENNFRVRDYLNEGQWRNVKTLSGGQTFQASLCLALSLADNIQQLNRSGQNFFFLDEGFGTLDREALELVFETLKSLRRENRVVGVISHVEDLQQEMNAWLRVTRDEEHGSEIKASWEA